MKYIKTYRDNGQQVELNHDEAKDLLSRYYTEKVATFDEMLEQPGTYPCMYSDLEVKAE